jgi:periplasmic protein CpxP/Spy
LTTGLKKQVADAGVAFGDRKLQMNQNTDCGSADRPHVPRHDRRPRMLMLRSIAPLALVTSLVIADALLAPALAQATNTGRAGDGQTAPAPAFDQTAARIKYLHDRLRITAEQEPLWDAVAQAIRDNAEGLTPLLKERLRAETNGTAPDLLRSYETLGDTQLNGLKKIIAAFDPLYSGLSDSQKKIADAVLREGAQNAMTGGVPFVPPPFGPALAYPLLWGGPALPLLVHRHLGFHHFGRFRY